MYMKYQYVKLNDLLEAERYLLDRMRNSGLNCWGKDHARIAVMLNKLHEHFANSTLEIPPDELEELNKLTNSRIG